MLSIARYNKRIEELEAELSDVKAAKAAEKREIQNSVQPVYRFTLTPVPTKGFHEIMDDSIILVRLEGEVLNAEAMRAVDKEPFSGGMTYYFNTLSGKIVTSEGGGNVWVSPDSSFANAAAKADARRTFDVLSRFIVDNPEGGDVTDIVNEYRNKWKHT